MLQHIESTVIKSKGASFDFPFRIKALSDFYLSYWWQSLPGPFAVLYSYPIHPSELATHKNCPFPAPKV